MSLWFSLIIFFNYIYKQKKVEFLYDIELVKPSLKLFVYFFSFFFNFF